MGGEIFLLMSLATIAGFFIAVFMLPDFWRHRTRLRELEHAERLEAMKRRAERDKLYAEHPEAMPSGMYRSFATSKEPKS